MSSYVKNGSPEKMRTVEDSNAEKWQHGKYGIDEKQRNRDQYEIYRGLV